MVAKSSVSPSTLWPTAFAPGFLWGDEELNCGLPTSGCWTAHCGVRVVTVEGGRSGRQERCPALVSAADAHVAFSVLTYLSRFKREARSGPAHQPGHSREKRAPKKIGYCGRVEERAGDAADEQERERGAIERHPRDSIANQAPSKTG